MLNEGIGCKEATDKIIEEYKDEAGLHSEYCGSFWIPLGRIQFEKGEIDNRGKNLKVLEIIDNNIDLDNLVGLDASENSIKERASILQNFRKIFGCFWKMILLMSHPSSPNQPYLALGVPGI